MRWLFTILVFTLFTFSSGTSQAQILDHSWEKIVHEQKPGWYSSQEAIDIAENVILYQRNIGGWPKNIQMQRTLSNQEKEALWKLKNSSEDCTIDNGATTLEMLFLSKIYKQVPDEKYKKAFLLGLDYILQAQYDNGGWPQFYPLVKGYYSHITYNDGAMVNVMNLLKALIDESGYYSISPPVETMVKINIAFAKGLDCILKTQYKQNGTLTSWCAQHDEVTLEPAKARAYELPSLSGKESAGIVLLLMSIKNPSPEIITSINSAVDWFEKVKITGIREDKFYNQDGKIIDKKIIEDPTAQPLWARFMDLEDNTPFYCDRDGIKKRSMDEIGAERRNGYAWHTDDPAKVLKNYPKWKEVNSANQKTQTPKDEFNIVVAKDGSGDFTRIQDAINSAKSFPPKRVKIFIKNGVYYEKVKVHEWNTNLSLVGESKEKTIITYDDYFDKINRGRNSTFYTYTVLVEANDFYARNLTIQNTAGSVGQAVALSVISDRVVISNCNIRGNQDTVYASGIGNQYFTDCYIEGTTDFIFGGATALFENCVIHSKQDSYITAASTPEGKTYGYVFKNCKLTADNNVTKVYLGRPWRPYAKTVFINCELGSHILPEGWHNWNKLEAEKTSFYAEFKNSGPGNKSSQRVTWSHQLKKSEAKMYSADKIFNTIEGNSKSIWYLAEPH